MKSVTVNIQGMTCNHCVMSVRKELSRVPGVLVDEVTIGTAVLRFDSALAGEAEIRSAVEAAGYKATEITEEDNDPSRKGKEVTQ